VAYYLTGDYYRGDYYRKRGDPGLFSAIGSVLKGAVSVAGGFLRGGPTGALASGVSLFAPKQGLPAPRAGGGLTLPGGIGVHPTRILPGGEPFITRQGGATRSGYHLDKKTHSYEVRNRSMNPANPRALRRAVRREHSFVALAKRVLRGTGITIGRRSFGSKRSAKR
jgi:hypothetical protein